MDLAPQTGLLKQGALENYRNSPAENPRAMMNWIASTAQRVSKHAQRPGSSACSG